MADGLKKTLNPLNQSLRSATENTALPGLAERLPGLAERNFAFLGVETPVWQTREPGMLPPETVFGSPPRPPHFSAGPPLWQRRKCRDRGLGGGPYSRQGLHKTLPVGCNWDGSEVGNSRMQEWRSGLGPPECQNLPQNSIVPAKVLIAGKNKYKICILLTRIQGVLPPITKRRAGD